MENTGKIGLFGAAGAIGQSVAAALAAAGRHYRVIGRSRSALEAAFGRDPYAEIVVWNPDDPASVVAAAQRLANGGVPCWCALSPVRKASAADGKDAGRLDRRAASNA